MAYKMKGCSPLKQSPYKQDLNMDSTLGDVGNKVKSTVKGGIEKLKNTTIKDGLKAVGGVVGGIASQLLMSKASNIYDKVRAKDASTGLTKHKTLTKGTKKLKKKVGPVNEVKAQGIEKNVKVNKKSKDGNKGGSFLPKDENDSRYDDIKNPSTPLKNVTKKNGKPKSKAHLKKHEKGTAHRTLGELAAAGVNAAENFITNTADDYVIAREKNKEKDN